MMPSVFQWLVWIFTHKTCCSDLMPVPWLATHNIELKISGICIASVLYFRILSRKNWHLLLLVMGAKLSCIKRPHRSRTSHDNASSSAATSAENQQHPSSSAAGVPSPRRIVVSHNGRQIIRTVRTLQSGDAVIVTYPRTDLKTLILDTLRLLRSLVAK